MICAPRRVLQPLASIGDRRDVTNSEAYYADQSPHRMDMVRQHDEGIHAERKPLPPCGVAERIDLVGELMSSAFEQIGDKADGGGADISRRRSAVVPKVVVLHRLGLLRS